MNLDHQKWFEYEEASWARRHELLHPDDFLIPESLSCPEWFDRDMESQYRKGYQYGVIDAARKVFWLYRSGYVRPTEISNILEFWANEELHKWRKRAWSETPLQDMCGEPTLKLKKWAEIRQEIISRDDRCCQICGSGDCLEVHHETPVCEGGLPIPENLITLCEDCHKHL